MTSSSASPTKPPPETSTYWPRLAAVGATLGDLGLGEGHGQRQRLRRLFGAGGEDVAHGDGAGEVARLDAGDRGREGEGDARAIPRRLRQRVRDELDAADDDAGLALAAAEEEAVARQRTRSLTWKRAADARRQRREVGVERRGDVERDGVCDRRVHAPSSAPPTGRRACRRSGRSAPAASTPAPAATANWRASRRFGRRQRGGERLRAAAGRREGAAKTRRVECALGIGEAGADDVDAHRRQDPAPGAARRRAARRGRRRGRAAAPTSSRPSARAASEREPSAPARISWPP